MDYLSHLHQQAVTTNVSQLPHLQHFCTDIYAAPGGWLLKSVKLGHRGVLIVMTLTWLADFPALHFPMYSMPETLTPCQAFVIKVPDFNKGSCFYVKIFVS